MSKRLCFFVVILALLAIPAFGQDARTVLQAASTAMGATNLKTLQYSGTGFTAAVGQSYNVFGDDWPRFEITRYTRTIDFDARTSREDYIRRQGNYPPRGGGFTPLIGEQPQLFFVKGDHDAWNMNGNTPVPQPALAERRQLEIWLTPHGFIKAAQASGNARAFTRWQGGQNVTIVTFNRGKYRMNATINAQNLIEHVQTWVADPVLGDMVYEIRYNDWKDFGAVKYPTSIHVHNGNRFLIVSDDAFDLRITDVQANVAVPPTAVPEPVLTATIAPVRVQSQRLAEGVWLLGGGSHNSVLVEFRDYVAVVEAPLNEERSLAVIAEVRKLVPNKPIQYVVNTHHHFDHSGGLRTYVSEGATVITSETNKKFYEVVFYPSPRTIEPDRLSLYPWPTTVAGEPTLFETLHDKYVLSDGRRMMEIYALQGVNHSETMLVAYLPTEKILINADLYSPPAAGAQPPAPNASMTALYRNMQRLKIDVAQHVPIHGQPGPGEDFVRIMSRSSN